MKCCLECGAEFTPGAAHGDLCSTAHRKDWNNRRATRGATVFDLLMALRFERTLAKKLKVWTLLCRLAFEYRQEDIRLRAGRKSWRPPEKVIEERPFLFAIVISNTTWKRYNA